MSSSHINNVITTTEIGGLDAALYTTRRRRRRRLAINTITRPPDQSTIAMDGRIVRSDAILRFVSKTLCVIKIRAFRH